MKALYFVGIDVSKLTLDVAIVYKKDIIATLKIANTKAAIKKLVADLKLGYGCTSGNTIYCAEKMGLYTKFLEQTCVEKKLKLVLESPLHLKKSIGLIRGKSDKADAVRIAQYLRKNYTTVKIWLPPSAAIEQLRYLSSLRRRLLRFKNGITAHQKIESHYFAEVSCNAISAFSANSIEAIGRDICGIEKEMQSIISKDEELKRLMTLVTSVPYIGDIIGTEFLIYTNAFEQGWTGKKFSCYCGVAPFEYASGTSLKGKARVSLKANRQLKSLLYLAAIGNLRYKDSHMALFFKRKTAEGKNKMNVLTAICRKIILRVFACVRDNKLFTELTPA